MTITAAVLAGGQSRRMGTDKSLVELAGRPLIQHVLDRLRPLGWPILLVANHADRYQSLGETIVADVLPGKGSLGGIYTALHHSATEFTFCVACDMPFLNTALIRWLATLDEEADAVVPVVAGRAQGLHALYRRRCLPVISEQLARDELRISAVYDRLAVRFVAEADLRQYDPVLRSFRNVNTPEDLGLARQIIEAD